MSDERRIVRLHPATMRDRRRVVHVFSEERGYELTVPAGLRDRRLKVGRSLSDADVAELREAGRAYEAELPERRAKRRARKAAERPTEGVISALRESPDGRRVFVDLDGTYAVAVAPNAVRVHGLAVGRRLDRDAVARLAAGADLLGVLDKIDRFCSFRPRCAEEVRRKLVRDHEIDPDLAAKAVEIRARARAGILPDEEFAAWYLRTRAERKGKTPRSLRYDLIRLGVATEAVEAAIEAADRDAALDAGIRKAARGLDLGSDKGIRRFTDRLTRRGFTFAEAREALEALGSEGDAELDAAEEYPEAI